MFSVALFGLRKIFVSFGFKQCSLNIRLYIKMLKISLKLLILFLVFLSIFDFSEPKELRDGNKIFERDSIKKLVNFEKINNLEIEFKIKINF